MAHTVGEVARMVRVSVRTLHHYDEIGLLAPSGRSGAGYRLYTAHDVARLEQIVFLRELGLPLETIRRALDAPEAERLDALVAQRGELAARIGRLEAMLRRVDDTINRMQEGRAMTSERREETFDHEAYEAEAEARWGHTDAYAESKRRVARYGKEEWAALRRELQAVEAAFIAALDAGEPPDGKRAVEAAEAHREHIDRWFYPCSYAMHRGLADMYVADPRFTRHYDDQRAGLAQYVRDAIHANAAHVAD